MRSILFYNQPILKFIMSAYFQVPDVLFIYIMYLFIYFENIFNLHREVF